MKRLLPLLLIITLIFPVISWADELEQTTQELHKKQQELDSAQKALKEAQAREQNLSSGMGSLQGKLNTAIAEVTVKEAQVNKVLAELDNEEQRLEQQKKLRDVRIRALYKRVSTEKANQIISLLDANNLVSFAKVSEYQSQVLAEEEQLILELNNKVAQIDQKRAELQSELDKLAEQKRLAQEQVNSLQYQINIARNQSFSASSQISNINKDIAGLTQKQAEILAAKAAANKVRGSLGDSAPPSYTPAPPASPDQKYAFASYGVPHRVGMSQYGAAGRAHKGQNYNQILKAYFHNISIEKKTMPANIQVQGHGSVPFEDRYLKLVREMPRSWPMEALKAQAVLARTYAYKWIRDNRGPICTTQSCQVYKHSDNPNSDDYYDKRWFQAVSETRGMVVLQGDYPIGAYYASTNGGISQQSGQVWNTNLPYLKIAEDCNGNWPNNCYEFIAPAGSGLRSPWFHKPWGDRTGLTENSTGNNCASCNPWLTKAEILDLFNLALLHHQKGGTFSGAGVDVSPVASGGSSHAKVRSKVDNPITDFSTINFYQDKSIGQTGSVQVLTTNRGVVNIPGSSMFAAVNVRAPGSIYLNSKLFDVIYP